MVFVALACLVLGVVCGQWFFSPEVTAIFTQNSQTVLYLLMFAVGISIGLSKSVFRRVREYHFKILIIPLGIIGASVAAGALCAPLTGMPLRESVCIASGMGWYSLTGIMMTDLAGAQVGAVGFLGNLLREMLSFLIIPWIAKHLNHYTAIAPAGATSEDTTLSMLVRYTREEIVVLAVFNGILCSAAVPVLIRFFYTVLS